MTNRFIPPIFLAAAIFLTFVLVLPRYILLGLKSETIKTTEQKIQERESILKNLSTLKKSLEQQDSQVAKLNILIPSKTDVPELISTISSIAQQSGLAFSDLALSEPALAQDAGYRAIGADLKLTGTYSGLKSFLQSIEQSNRLFDVTHITAGAVPGSKTLSITMQTRGYYLQSQNPANARK